MMVPFFLSVFAIFLFRQFFKGYPDEIIHAARLDGVSELEIIWRIVAPSAWPAIAAFSVFSVVAHWNDLYWPLIVISETRLAPPPLGMMYFADAETGSNYGALTAGATIITAPLVLAFLVARRRPPSPPVCAACRRWRWCTASSSPARSSSSCPSSGCWSPR